MSMYVCDPIEMCMCPDTPFFVMHIWMEGASQCGALSNITRHWCTPSFCGHLTYYATSLYLVMCWYLFLLCLYNIWAQITESIEAKV